jgi:predicted acylesterase/phospholipase RssA
MLLGSASAVAAATARARAQTGAAEPGAASAPARVLRRSLVLSGGGALGAYEAGIVDTLVRAAGVAEGQPLPQYGIIAGTSIGALNGFLVATAQWSKLRGLWASIAAQNAVRLKREFAKIGMPSAGVVTRFAQVVALGLGARRNLLGVYDGAALQSWLQAYFDVSRPIVTPFIWAVTNLTRERPEYFYLLPPGFDATARRLALTSIQLSIGKQIPLREASHDLLIEQLRASAAVPIAFDPVLLPGTDGTPEQYVDGGVTANTPISVARAVSSSVDAVLLAPPFTTQAYQSITDVATGSFDTMQRALMYNAVRDAVLETVLYRAIRALPDVMVATMAKQYGYDASTLKTFANLLWETDYFVLRPAAALPVTVLGFSDAKAIRDTYRLGMQDAANGFRSFDLANIPN